MSIALWLPCLFWSSWQTIMWPSYQNIPRPSLPCLASTVVSGPVWPCSALSGAALFHPVWYYPGRPCPADVVLLYPTWRCSARSFPAPRDPDCLLPSLPCLALPCPALLGAALLYSACPCPALSCPSLSNPAGPCSCRADLPDTVQHCLALPIPVWPCPVLFGPAQPFSTPPVRLALLCSTLPGLARSCLALSWSTLSIGCPRIIRTYDFTRISSLWCNRRSSSFQTFSETYFESDRWMLHCPYIRSWPGSVTS